MIKSSYSNDRRLKKIRFSELLAILSSKARENLKEISENPDVEYFIVLQTQNLDKKKVIPAGRNLDFRSPRDVAGTIIGGMKATMFVDLKDEALESETQTENIVQNIADEAASLTRIKDLEAKVYQLETENGQLSAKVANAKAQLITRNNLIDELKKAQVILKEKIFDLENSTTEPVDVGRFNDVEKAEEELMARMNEYMEKEARLEQREEDLFYRERMLHEQETINKKIG